MRCLLWLAWLGASALAHPFADRLPPDTLFYAGTRDLGRLKHRVRGLGLWPKQPAEALFLLSLVEGACAVAGLPRGDGHETVYLLDCGPRARLFKALLARSAIAMPRRWFGSVVCFAVRGRTRARLADPGGETLAARAEFRSAGERADLFVYVAPPFWRRQVPGASALGLDSVRGVSGRVMLGRGSVRAELRIATSRGRGGLLRILEATKPALGPPAFLPETTRASFTFSIDYREALRLARRLPGFLAEARALKRGLGVDLASDLVPALDRELTIAFVPEPVVIQKLVRPRRIEQLLDRLSVPQREVEGRTVRILPGERLGVVAILEDHLVVTTRLDTIRRLAGGRPGLVRTDLYRSASAEVPRERDVFGFAGASSFALRSEVGGLRLSWFVR